MCGELTCSLGVLRVHDDVRVASKHGSGPAAVLCWTSICCWVGGSNGSFVLDVDLLLGWRVRPQSGGLQAVQSCGAQQVLITRDRQTDRSVVFNAQCAVMGTWG